MNSKRIQEKVDVIPQMRTLNSKQREHGHDYASYLAQKSMPADSVSFTGNLVSEFPKRGWLALRKISKYMNEPSEMTNATIACVGTGAIAPFAIMTSPKTREEKKLTPEELKEKKEFQALRQPVSAALQLGFQVPTTLAIGLGFNKLAYERGLFKDDTLKTLVPDKKYLQKQIKKYLSGKLSGQELITFEREIKPFIPANYKSELITELRKAYEEVELDVPKKKLEKLAENPKRQIKFLAEKIADAKHKELLKQKINELSNEKFKIKAKDLVDKDSKTAAKRKYKLKYDQLEKDAKLNFLDKFMRSMGFSGANKKLKKLKKKQEAFENVYGFQIIKEDNPDILSKTSNKKIETYIKVANEEAQKVFKNKIFWLSLVTNLGMVAASCLALNWLHPRFAVFVDEIKAKRQANNEQKVEVTA